MKIIKYVVLIIIGSLLAINIGFVLARGKLVAELSPQQPEAVNAMANNMAVIGRLSGNSYAVDVQDDYAYVGIGNRMVVLNIFSPSNPVVAGQSEMFPQIIQDIVVEGNYAYIADEVDGLYIIDISTPGSPTTIGHFNAIGEAYGVAVSANRVYIAAAWGGLRIIDVSNPSNPTEVGSLWTPGWHEKVVVAGNYAYLTNANGTQDGLRIIDISDPSAPVEVGFANTTAWAKDVAVEGNYAYVAAHNSGLRIIDIQDPTNPIEVGFHDTPGQSFGIKILGNHAYIADGLHGGLQIININSPISPVFEGSLITSSIVWDVDIDNGYVYMANWGEGLRIVDVQSVSNPNEVSFFDSWPNYALDLDIEGTKAYLADEDGGMRIIDIDDPTAPVLQGTFDFAPGNITAVDTRGNYAFVGDRNGTFWVVDVSDSNNPVHLGSSDANDSVRSVAVMGNRAYVAQGSLGIRVMDITNPNNPTQLRFVSTPNSANDVVVTGNYAYVADVTSLRIIDIANYPYTNTVGFIDDNVSYLTVDPANVGGTSQYAYVGVGSTFKIIDVSIPSSPTEVSSYTLPSGAWIHAISIADNLAYIAQSGVGVRVLDIGNPLHPIEVGYYTTPRVAEDVVATNGYAYVANGDNGFMILDFTATTHTFSPGESYTLTYTDTQDLETKLHFPSGTFTDTTTLLYTPFSNFFSAPSGYAFGSHAFSLTPYVEGIAQYNLNFQQSVTVSLSYSDNDIMAISNEAQLMWQYWDVDAYVDATNSCTPASSYTRDVDNNMLHVPICQATFYALVGPSQGDTIYLPIITRQ